MSDFAWVNIFFCSLAFISTWAFEKQRRFPVSLVGWISLIDIAFNIWQLMYASSTWKALNDFEADQPEVFCHLETVISEFFAFASLITNTLLAFTIYNLLRRRQDMSPKNSPWYRYSFVAIFWVVTISFPVGLGNGPVHTTLGFCGPSSTAGIVALIVPFCFCVALQIIFIFMTLYHIQTVTRNVSRQMTDTQRKLRRKDYWMYGRFVMIIVIQIVQWFPTYIFWLQAVTNDPSPSFYFETVLGYMNEVGFIVESLVIIASNRSLRFWVGTKVFGLTTNRSTSDSGEHPTKDTNLSGGNRTGSLPAPTTTPSML